MVFKAWNAGETAVLQFTNKSETQIFIKVVQIYNNKIYECEYRTRLVVTDSQTNCYMTEKNIIINIFTVVTAPSNQDVQTSVAGRSISNIFIFDYILTRATPV